MATLEASRQEYLKKRDLKKIEQLRDSIEDYVFDGIKLTEAEYHYQDLRYRKELYELVKKRPTKEDKSEEYRIPEAYDQEGHVNQKKQFAVALHRQQGNDAAAAAAAYKRNSLAEWIVRMKIILIPIDGSKTGYVSVAYNTQEMTYLFTVVIMNNWPRVRDIKTFLLFKSMFVSARNMGNRVPELMGWSCMRLRLISGGG